MRYLLILLFLCLPAQAFDAFNGTTQNVKNIRKLTVNGSVLSGNSVNGNALFSLDHNRLVNFSANKHIDHTAVTLTAGSALTGGGDISASRTFDLATNGSLVVTNDKVQLNGDTASPGNSKYYGTNSSGTKGWNALTLGTVTQVKNGDIFTSVATQTTTPVITIPAQTSANWATKISDEVGTGRMVFNGSPTFSTPALGTPSSVTLTNATGLPISTGVSGLGAGVATFLATPSSANLISAVTNEIGTGRLVFNGSTTLASPTLVTPALGTPSSGTLTSCTGLPISTGVSGLGTGIATALATPSSANWASAFTDEVGTGKILFNGTPLMSSATLNKTTTINGNTLSIPALTQGDLVFSKVASSMTRLGKGTNHYVLKTNGNTLAWEAGGGTVTQVKNGDVFTSIANQTTTPTISLASQSSATWAGVFTDEVGTGKFLLNGTPLMSSATLNKTTTVNGNTLSIPSLTQGDILFSKVASSITRLAKGTNHYVLKTNGNILAWESGNSGTVTQVKNGDVFTSVANQTTTPTITLASTTSANWSSKISDIVGTGKFMLNGTPLMSSVTLNKTTTINGNTLSIPALNQGAILYTKVTGAFSALDNGASSNHKALKVNGNTLAWESLTSGTVTSVSNGDRFLAVTNKTTTPSITTLAQGSAAWATKFSDEVGTGRIVFNGSPTFSTPTLGAATATSINSTTIPSSKTLVVTTDKLSVLAATSSSELAGVISDEIGSGRLVFNGSTTLASPTLVTPAIGAATGTSLVTTGRIIAGTNVNGTTANLTKVLASGSINGATLNTTTGNITNIAATKMIATGSVNGSTVTAKNLAVANGAYSTTTVTIGNGGTAKAIDFSKGIRFSISLNAATLAISAGTDPLGDVVFPIAINQRAGSQAVTWTACASASGFCFPGGTVPTITTTANAIDIFSCWYRIVKDRYYCQAGADFK